MKIRILTLCILASACCVLADVNVNVVPEDIFAAINLHDMKVLTNMLKVDKDKVLASRTTGGITPLHYAASLDNTEAVYRLLEVGVKPDIRSEGSQTTPLHWASDKGAEDSLRLLIQKGADVNAQAKNGFTPLHFVAKSADPSLAKYLIDAGASINALDNKGNTPLHIASFFGNGKVVAFLLQVGANSSITNAEGNTAVALAKDEQTSQFFTPQPSPTKVPSGEVVASVPSNVTSPTAVPLTNPTQLTEGTSSEIKQLPQPSESVSSTRLSVGEQYRKFLNDPNTIRLDDGSAYQGEMHNGKFNGFGVLCNQNRERYEGEWKNGVKSGVGTYTYPNGDSYAGGWRNNVPHGAGVFAFANGGRIKGTWKNGILAEGQGSYISATDGSKFYGQWKDSELVSTHSWTDSDSE